MSRRPPRRDAGTQKCKCGSPGPMMPQGCCYECLRERQGCKRTEKHHAFGRYSADVKKITVEVPGNWHRAFTDEAAARPDILKRPGDNPLHQIAAVIVALAEAAKLLADHARREQWPEWTAILADVFAGAGRSAADWLLILAGKLDERFGPQWAEDLGMPKWQP